MERPARLPGPPWTLEASGVIWVCGRAVGALVRYAASPVGPYSEVWGTRRVTLRRGRPAITVPFMAVDLEASLLGGRAIWALPKTRASFAEGSATGDGWSIRVRVVSVGVRVPLAVLGVLEQSGDARAPLRARGIGRLARIDVRTTGTVPEWLRAGRHPGIVLERTRLTLGAPYRPR